MEMINEVSWKEFQGEEDEFDSEEIVGEIKRWFMLEDKIESLELEKLEANELYYESRSFYTHIGYTELGIYSLSSRVDEVATEAADIAMTYDKRISRLKKQLELFEKLFSEEERNQLRRRYLNDYFEVDMSDKSLYDKLNSIKEVCISETRWMMYQKKGILS